ncbi:MAG TPA: DNA-3-methyladenine glycosylase [Balneolales bacterium]|nr:DNA-3-methyladenine glycosylase [Balneolales bacterium]
MKLDLSFYRRDDVLQISRELLGKVLYSYDPDEGVTGGIIVETEAYAGAIDRASHAYGNRRTNRTEVMYAPGGLAYVYLCYGIHSLFNVITGFRDIPHAVLIRALEPVEGLDIMLKRRNIKNVEPRLTAGPGMLTKALGITTTDDGTPLNGERIWIEDNGNNVTDDDILTSPRVGIDYAGDDAQLPYRFRIKDSRWTSKAE